MTRSDTIRRRRALLAPIERGEGRVTALAPRYRVRLPLISTRDRVQIGGSSTACRTTSSGPSHHAPCPQSELETTGRNRLRLLMGRATPNRAIQPQRQHLVRDVRLLLGDDGTADDHDESDDAVDALGALVLRRLEVAGGVLGDRDVGGHPAGHRVGAVASF
jgi:hypothetical protein